MAIPFIYIAMIMGWVLLIVGYVFREYVLVMIPAFFLTVIGIYIIVNGIGSIENWVTNIMGIIHIAIAGYLLVSKGIGFIQEWM